MRNFRKLEIWNNAILYAKKVYEITDTFPDKEKFGLISQLRRAVVSIPSNIAEGSSRKTEPDFARFLEIAQGSSFELETQLIIAKEINYINDQQLLELLSELTILQKQINQLITVLRR